MVEGQMDHAISRRRTAAQAVEIFERSAMHFRAGSGEGRCSRIRAGEADHPVAGGDQFVDHGGANKSSGAGDKDTHEEVSRVKPERTVCVSDILVK